jgi:hypothetical protein
MMILDERTEFADATSVGTPNNTTVNVGDVIDLQEARDIGAGHPLYLVVTVDTAIGSSGSATVRFKLSSDSTSTLSVDGTQTEHATSDAIAVASLIAGYKLVIPVPAENPAFERYLGFQVQEAAGSALNAGKVNAFLTHDASIWKAYADATN